MEPHIQTSQSIEIATKQEVSMRRILNIIGIFIFCGLALTNVTNPLPSIDYIKGYLLFIGGSAIIYFILLNIYFIGQIGRMITLITLFLIGFFSVFMSLYLVNNSISL